MSGETSISWTDATWNPVRGCSRVSEGCRNCYAERQAARFVKPGQPFHGFAKVTAPRDSLDRFGGRRNGWTGKVELIPSALDWPLRWRGFKLAKAEGRPSRIFVNSMSDLFHEALTDEEIAAVFGVMAAAPQHTFQILTKRPDRMRAWFDWVDNAKEEASEDYGLSPIVEEAENLLGQDEYGEYLSRGVGTIAWPLPNVWLGTSVENQATADERITHLLATPAAVRFVSYEPAIGPVNFRFRGRDCSCIGHCRGRVGLGDSYRCVMDVDPQTPLPPRGSAGLDWLIVGGESGPGARPFDVAWARSTVAQCKAAGVPVFVKQLGARPISHCPHCNGVIGPVMSGWTDSCGSEHDALIRASQRILDRKGGDWSEWPEDLRAREIPA